MSGGSAPPSPEEFLAAYPPELRALAEALRALVLGSVPGAIERVAPGWRLIGYRVPDGRRGRYFAYIAPLDGEVRLGFEYGAALADQASLAGSGSQVRYAAVRSLADVDEARLAPLVAEAAMLAVTRRRG